MKILKTFYVLIRQKVGKGISGGKVIKVHRRMMFMCTSALVLFSCRGTICALTLSTACNIIV